MRRLLLAAVLLAGTAWAQDPTLDLSRSPLFLNANVEPNLTVSLDDSSSMNWGFLPDEIRGENCVWRHPRYYAANYNRSYYDPAVEYKPPINPGNGQQLPQASFTAARANGFNFGNSPIFNLGTQYYVTWTNIEPITPTFGTTIHHQDGATSMAPGQCPGDPRTFAFPSGGPSAFYCKLNPGANPMLAASYQCQGVTEAEKQNFANWFSYHRVRGLTLKTSLSRAFAPLEDDIRLSWQNFIANPIVPATQSRRFAALTRSQFFGWLQASPFGGSTPSLEASVRVGDFYRRSGNVATNPYWDVGLQKELSCRQNFHLLVTDGYWNENNHPVGSAAAGASITPRTLPDGVAYQPDSALGRIYGTETPRLSNCVVGANTPNVVYNNYCNPSFADIAFNDWATDLRPDLANNVVPYFADLSVGVLGPAAPITPGEAMSTPEVYFNPRNDPATWQHLVQYVIGFGVNGQLPYSEDTYQQLRLGQLTWPGAGNFLPRSIDDIWRGSIASRGNYFSASNPNQVAEALESVLSSVIQRKGSVTPLSVSSGILTAQTLSFQTQFDSTDWSGTVLARSINADFELGEVIWDASCLLTGGDCESTGENSLPALDWDSGRQILSAKTPSGDGIPFRWNQLSTWQQDQLKRVSAASPNMLNNGHLKLQFLRGDRSKEAANGGSFRNRKNLFGSVIHSGVVYVGPPAAAFDRSWPAGSAEAAAAAAGQGYAEFKALHAQRPATLYVGANDGMLHALDAGSGKERFAYVPYAAYHRLMELARPFVGAEVFVDLTPTVRDVYTNGAWRTLLVGGLRRGGQGVYALDVTDPAITESAAASKVLWEFNDASSGGADLGYTYAQPFITRLAHGGWVVLLPAAYNSAEADAAPGSGSGVMFVLDAGTGSVLRKFNLGSAGAGLTTAMAADLDGNEITEYAYAGDLAGQIWRFDLSADVPTAWDVELFFDPATPGARPITAQPRLLLDPASGRPWVLVGTGKYLEPTDRSPNVPVQAFYGILDQGALPIEEDELAQRTLLLDGEQRRVEGPVPGADDRGWMLKLASITGERVINAASLRVAAGRVLFTTLIPQSEDPCIPGASGYLLALDARRGGPSEDGVPLLDANGDGELSDADDPEVVGSKIDSFVSGIAVVVPPGGGVDAVLLPDKVIKTPGFDWRRRSWRDTSLDLLEPGP